MATFNSLEISADSSSPIELYEFTYEAQTVYFTSSEEDQIIGGITYTASQIARSNITDSGEIGKNNLTLTCPDQFPIAELFAAGPPDDIVTVVVKRVQFGALNSSNTVIIWLGRITTVEWPPQRSVLNLESVFTSLRQSGIRRVYTVNCPYALYGVECTVNILSFQSTITIDTQTGNVLTGTALGLQPNGWWAGGRIIWQNPQGVLVKRGIKNHTGTEVEITFAMPNFPNGASVLIAPGCNHSYSDCVNKFANGPQFGGFPFMVQKNPWGSSSVF